MTKVEVFKKDGRVIRYRASGHSGYDVQGQDIVCSAISMTLQLPLGGMMEILGLKPEFKINQDGYLEVELEKMDTKGKSSELNTLLDSMVLMINELSKQYPKNIKLVVKEEN